MPLQNNPASVLLSNSTREKLRVKCVHGLSSRLSSRLASFFSWCTALSVVTGRVSSTPMYSFLSSSVSWMMRCCFPFASPAILSSSTCMIYSPLLCLLEWRRMWCSCRILGKKLAFLFVAFLPIGNGHKLRAAWSPS